MKRRRSTQLEIPGMPPKPATPPKPRRKLMQLWDAGERYSAWECPRCGHEVKWHGEEAGRKTTFPCPKCSPPGADLTPRGWLKRDDD